MSLPGQVLSMRIASKEKVTEGYRRCLTLKVTVTLLKMRFNFASMVTSNSNGLSGSCAFKATFIAFVTDFEAITRA